MTGGKEREAVMIFCVMIEIGTMVGVFVPPLITKMEKVVC